MQGWTEGYVTEIGYTHGFHVELLPWEMAAALPDAPISPGQPFDYCELGFGQGFSLALMAAANPQARFWGNDFNPDHVAHVRGLADAAGLTNLTVSEKGFRDYRREPDLPAFDMIALHGVWSWVGPAARADVVRFIEAKLKPGGLVYIGYNVLPGWAQYLPLRRLMLEQARRTAGDLPTRIGAALELASRLEGQGADYFRINPTLSPRLAQLRGRPAQYLAHEYFNESWEPVYFADIAADLAAIDVHFAGQRRAADRWEAALQAPAIAEAAGPAGNDDPVFVEMLRDYLTNRPFRRDLFRRGGGVPAAPVPDPSWAALGHPRDLPRRATLPGGSTVEPDWHLSQDILASLQAGPLPLSVLQARHGAGVPGALGLLAALDLLAPALPPAGLQARATTAQRLNAVILQQALQVDRLQALACPATGGAIAVDRVEQLFLHALGQQAADPAQAAWDVLAASGQRLLRDGRLLETPKQNLVELEERWQRFRQRRLPLLQGLGAVQQ
ncbi:class I SAM-dependent methyltransferase [Niveispirillum sp. BGYR6]|uniref:class I SAM-dependent methyltransferase n=1 Tax=Niveispirillum sp. BGYR6 TaxID=2971249 RepID=UPI0022B9BFBE|nr:class I SAM-dependent methyltransferase [Niveispirillum sp. BGYR6]MDG5497052.1 methyltransferase regulatory domain-containing protein [Niveispirillum sp. BGYR6]